MVIPYITFNGNCQEALEFYKSAVNAKIENVMHFGDSPMEVPEGAKKKIMHSTFNIFGSPMMASDTMPGQDVNAGGPITLSLNFDSKEEQQKTFDALSKGGRVNMPLQETFWGAIFGMCTDKFGVNWMFNHDIAKK